MGAKTDELLDAIRANHPALPSPTGFDDTPVRDALHPILMADRGLQIHRGGCDSCGKTAMVATVTLNPHKNADGEEDDDGAATLCATCIHGVRR